MSDDCRTRICKNGCMYPQNCPHDPEASSLASATGSGAKSYSVHMSQSITGPLINWKEHDWEKATQFITRNDGSRYTPEELKRAFVDELRLGHEVVPIGDCDNFDWKRGCQGHPQPPNDGV